MGSIDESLAKWLETDSTLHYSFRYVTEEQMFAERQKSQHLLEIRKAALQYEV